MLSNKVRPHRRCCFEQGVGLNDFLKSLPTCINLRYSEMPPQVADIEQDMLDAWGDVHLILLQINIGLFFFFSSAEVLVILVLTGRS